MDTMREVGLVEIDAVYVPYEKSGFRSGVISITHMLKGMLVKRENEKAFAVIKLPVSAVMSLLLSYGVSSLRRVKRRPAGALNLPLYIRYLAFIRPSYLAGYNRHNLYLSGLRVTSMN